MTEEGMIRINDNVVIRNELMITELLNSVYKKDKEIDALTDCLFRIEEIVNDCIDGEYDSLKMYIGYQKIKKILEYEKGDD